MSLVQYDTKMLYQRNGYWYYQRRVPKKYAHIDSRRVVKKALGTKSIDDAIAKRDALIKADDQYWSALSIEVIEQGGVSEKSLEVKKRKYKAAEARALTYGIHSSLCPLSSLRIALKQS